MRRRSVVVLFQHHLFGAAIARALGEGDQLTVTALALNTLSSGALAAIHPDAIVLEGSMTRDVGIWLLGVAPVLTVIVGPQTNTAEVYERHAVIEGTAGEIAARILAASGPKRGTATRRRAKAGVREPRIAPVQLEGRRTGATDGTDGGDGRDGAAVATANC